MGQEPKLVDTTYALLRVIDTLLTYVASTKKGRELLIQVPYDTVLPANPKYKHIYLTLDLKATWDERLEET
jgi:hypothetical protein